MKTVRRQTHQAAAPWARQLLFLVALAVLVLSAVDYVWLQGPLHASIVLERQLAENVGRIMTLDEVLTMSAKMAASAHDPAYEKRYAAHVDELDRLIRETVALVPDVEVDRALSSTEDANRQLVDMETRSFELDHLGQQGRALSLLESEEYRAQKATYASGMARAFTRMREVTSEKRLTAERWTHLLQLVALLSLGVVLVTWTLERRRARAASYASELSATVELRTRELAERSRSMRLVLDSVQEGLLTIDLDGRMSSERSAILESWLGPVDSALTFEDYARRHDPKFAELFGAELLQVKEGFLPFELCIDQMPKRLTLGSMTIAVAYESMLTDGRVSGLLLVLRDISAEIEGERAQTEQRELVTVVQLARRDREGLLGFIDEADKMVERLLATDPESTGTQARLIHTLKGNSAQLGLSLVSSVCHEVEERLSVGGELTRRDRELLESTWLSTKERIGEIVGDRSSTHMDVEKAQFDEVLELVRHHTRHERILEAMSTWTLDPVQARLDRLSDYARSLAERLGKPKLELCTDAHELRMDGASWGPFWAVCVHLIRNAVDHGIEMPEERRARGKPEQGRLELSADRFGTDFIVCIADDGAGIDWERLAERAALQGLPANTPSERVEALFSDCLSSRDDVTEISGRGLGMAAVREEVRRRGGSIEVMSKRGSGTTIELRFPVESAFRPDANQGMDRLVQRVA